MNSDTERSSEGSTGRRENVTLDLTGENIRLKRELRCLLELNAELTEKMQKCVDYWRNAYIHLAMAEGSKRAG